MICHLTEDWLQEIVRSLQMPAISPSSTRAILPTIEMHLRKLLQFANKFQRRSKKQFLTIDDFNLALSMQKLEPLYGLFQPPSVVKDSVKINFVELLKQPIPRLPTRSELATHWLVVEGEQPMISENPTPTFISSSRQITEFGIIHTSEQAIDLPREMQLVYMRIIRAMDGGVGAQTLSSAVCDALLTDPGMQSLVPYISLFVYAKVREPTKSVEMLHRLMRTVWCLVLNPSINVENHLQQLLPAIFTCIVAHQLDSNEEADHFSLRQLGTEIISCSCVKYATSFPDLQARVLKTYLDGLGVDKVEITPKSLNTIYGAVAGLASLGTCAIGTLLLPRLPAIVDRIRLSMTNAQVVKWEPVKSQPRSSSNSGRKRHYASSPIAAFKLSILLTQTIGNYQVKVLREVEKNRIAREAVSIAPDTAKLQSHSRSGKRMSTQMMNKPGHVNDIHLSSKRNRTIAGNHLRMVETSDEAFKDSEKWQEIYTAIVQTLDVNGAVYTSMAQTQTNNFCCALFI